MASKKFSNVSLNRLNQCVPALQALFHAVNQKMECSILTGFRGKEEQDAAKNQGASKAAFGQSPHNYLPSFAVDAAPYPIDWNNTKRFYDFAKIVLETAKEQGITIRWGGDWDGDGDFKDQKFNDLVHFEILGWKEKV